MPSPSLHRYLGLAWKIAVLIGILIAAKYAGEWILGKLTPHLLPSTELALHRFIMLAIAIYIILMMLPFIPGVEIGLGMIVMFGPRIAPLVYGSTVLALILSFLIGRLIPQQAIVELFETMRLKRAASLLRDLEALEPEQRLAFFLNNSSTRIVPFLLRYRFIALIIAFNLPGNTVIGGGGGIGLVAGFSRLFTLPKYILAVAIAVSPIPLMVMISGA
jgi:hypothetical protein